MKFHEILILLHFEGVMLNS